MSKFALALAAIIACSLAQPGYANVFSVQVVEHGSSGGVSSSWLHYGGTNGSGVTDKWRINGDILVDYFATGGDDANGPLVQLVSGPTNDNTLDIYDGVTIVGTMEITGLRLWDPGDLDGSALGYIDIALTSNGSSTAFGAQVAVASDVRIDFRDQNYGSTSNGFNGFGLNSGGLGIRMWGDENQYAPSSSVNWGIDWTTSGTTAVPAPSAVVLAMIGMSFVGRVRRRFAS